ncbi:hypothetical protein ID866_1543 [Astraeus odoratus]|nr:hypothetical protein ID866_1543 [Astraeus odoratus]
MEELYKDVNTTRGFKYHYLFIKAKVDKPTLVFLHGFPDTLHGWHHQVDYFRTKGYGLVVPDMLGYGGTDKPVDPAAFLYTAIAQDIVDILDAEEVQNVGSVAVSMLSINHSDRFLGFVFMAVPYSPPRKYSTLEMVLKEQERVYGHPVTGYWTFFTNENAAVEIEGHMDSFLDVLYPLDPDIWKVLINIPGKLEPFVVEGKRLANADYLPEPRREQLKKLLAQGGMESPLNWYKSMVQGIQNHTIDGLKPEDLIIKRPTFFALAKYDYVAIESYAKTAMQQYTPAELLTQKSYGTGHWVHLEDPERFNTDLEFWIETTTRASV